MPIIGWILGIGIEKYIIEIDHWLVFIFSMIGLRIGKEIGSKLGKSATIFGRIVLITIGIKILIEHLLY